MDGISWVTHSLIDFILCAAPWQHVVRAVGSDRTVPLASHQFPVYGRFSIRVDKMAIHNQRARPNARAMRGTCNSNRFAELFDLAMVLTCFDESEDLGQKYA